MSNSLRDQLLKAGLVTPEQATAATQKPKPKVRRGGKKVPKPAREATPRQQPKPPQSNYPDKALRAQIKQLLRSHRLNNAEAELPYNFVEGKYVRRLHVTAEQQAALGAGQLAIVGFGQLHYLIPVEAVDAVRALWREIPVHIGSGDETVAEDDPYADFPVPDDLIW